MADSFKVKGLDEALANLKQLTVEVAAVAVPKAARAAAQVFKDDVKPRIPKKTGNLAKTLRIAKKKYDTGRIVGYSVRVGTRREFQAFLLEFGFHHVGSGAWVQIPFMRPAYDGKAAAALDAFVESLRQSVAAARAGRIL